MSKRFKVGISLHDKNRKIQTQRAAVKQSGGLSMSPQGNDLYDNFSSLNTVIYGGRQDRMQRYNMYDIMDQDTDIARAIDIIAESCTNNDPTSKTPFDLEIEENSMSEDDSFTLFEMLRIWSRHNRMDNMAFRMIRNTIKYGDAFFVRGKDFKLYPIHPSSVHGVYVDQVTQEIIGYHLVNLVRNFDFLMEAPNGQKHKQSNVYSRMNSLGPGAQVQQVQRYTGIAAPEHIVHLSMSEGRDTGGNGQNNDIWPFGTSVLEAVYKDYRMRSLLEDAEVIHRIQRAPSRRAFFVDVSKMRPDQAEARMRKLKNELHQKRIPSLDGGKNSVDSVYNPVSQLEDIFIPVTSDGRGTKIEDLQGQAWTGSDALEYFNSKFLRGLRVPVSFMLGPEEGGSQYNDGRSGSSYIQELQFSKYCNRIQNTVIRDLDFEFKLFVNYRGVETEANRFRLSFVPPLSFEEYREAELNEGRLGRLNTALGISIFSKRFAMQNFGGMTEDQILENERMWREENQETEARQYAQDNNLGGMGVGSGGGFGGGFGDDFGGGGFGDDFGGDGFGGEMMGDGAGMDTGMDTGPATAPGTESFKIIPKGEVLMEKDEDITRKVRYDSRQDTEEDGGHNDNMHIPPRSDTEEYLELTPLSTIRSIRLEREKNRLKMLQRLDQLTRQYGDSGDGGGLF